MEKKFVDSLNIEQLIDIRDQSKWDELHLKNAKHIEKNELDDFPQAYLSKGFKYYIFGQKSNDADELVKSLVKLGYEVENVGGFEDYEGEIEGEEYNLDCKNQYSYKYLIEIYNKISQINNNDILNIESNDIGFNNEITSWVNNNGHELISLENYDNLYKASIKKLDVKIKDKLNSTIVLSVSDYDKVMYAMYIALTKVTMNYNVNILFTFESLKYLKDESKVENNQVDKKENMLSKFIPSTLEQLTLPKTSFSNKNNSIIKDSNNIDNFEDIYDLVLQNNIKIIACSMSIDLLNIKANELYDNVIIGGLGTISSKTNNSDDMIYI